MSIDFLARMDAASRERAAAAKRGGAAAADGGGTNRVRRGFADALAARDRGRRVIAEIKRASPSKGALDTSLDAVEQAMRYAAGGAAAISVLTEPTHFRGTLGDLAEVARAVDVPVLRKDFLVDPWQVGEARRAGADAVLLIAEMLPGDSLGEMLAASKEAGVDALVELHEEAEFERVLASGARVIGINARNLRTLAMEPEVFARLLPRIPLDRIAVAESGLASAEDLAAAESHGARAFLVGEALVRAGDPAATLAAWGCGLS